MRRGMAGDVTNIITKSNGAWTGLMPKVTAMVTTTIAGM